MEFCSFGSEKLETVDHKLIQRSSFNLIVVVLLLCSNF